MSRRSKNRKAAATEQADSPQPSVPTEQKSSGTAIRLAASVLPAALYLAALFIFGWFTQFYQPPGGPPYLRDGDELYHFHHAELYREYGIFHSAFPYLTFSVISRDNADLWYGFHVLLIPFTAGGDPVMRIKWAICALTTVSAAIVLLAVKLRGARLPYLWPTLFLFATGFGLNRFYTLRPGVLSMALLCLLIGSIFAESSGDGRGRKWLIAGVAALFAFVHLTVIWLPVLVCALIAIASPLLSGRWRGREIGWTCLGLLIGAVLRPNPAGALHLLCVQTVVLAAARLSGAVRGDISEMAPLPGFAWPTMTAFTVVLVILTALAAWRAATPGCRRALTGDEAAFAAVTGALTLAFGIGTICAAQRCLEQFQGFGALYLSCLATALLDRAQPLPALPGHAPLPRGLGISPKGGEKGGAGANGPLRLAAPVGAFLIALAFVWQGAPNAFRGDPTTDLNPYRLADAATWLKTNAPPGSVVFHARWSDFPLLWFWDDRDRYIAGMDPVFSYADNPPQPKGAVGPDKFFEYGQFRQDRVGDGVQVVVNVGSVQSPYKDTHDALVEDFHANYAVVEPDIELHFAAALASDPRARLAYEEPAARVYALAP